MAAVLLLPLAVWVALIADGLAQALLARLRGGAFLPSFPQAIDAVGRLAGGMEGTGDRRPLILSSAVSLLLASALFLLIPPGRFPAVLGTPIDTVLISLLFVLGIGVETAGMPRGPAPRRRHAGREALLEFGRAVPVALVLGSVSWAAWRTGMPGNPLSVEVFVSKSVWSAIDGMGRTGLALLGAALTTILPTVSVKALAGTESNTECLTTADGDVARVLLRIGASLLGLALAALCVSIFVPFWASALLGRGGLLSAGFDFFLFWIEAVLLRMSAVVVFELLARRLGVGRTVRLCVASAWILALGGGGLLLAGL